MQFKRFAAVMADMVVGITACGKLWAYAVGKRTTEECSAFPRGPLRQSFRSRHGLEKKSLRWRPPWKAGRSGMGVLAMTQRQALPPSSSDFEKDESMVFRRTVFDHEDWTRHRSSDRHSRHILSIASSRVIRSLGPPVLKLTFIATLVAAFNETVLADVFPSWVPLLLAPSLPFQLTAPALALLLVFRTNASYGRFDEARKAWGSNVNRSRDFSRQALTWIRLPADSEKLDRLLRYSVALAFCLKDHLIQGEAIVEDLKGLLDQNELEAVLRHSHKPNYVLQTMSEIIYNCSLSDMERALLDRNLTQFHDNLGTCERIFKTPIPLSYTRLTSRFLVIWHAALPFALWDQCRWLVVPATFFSAGALFCIEEVGVLIEEPLSMLSLNGICLGIQKSVEGLIQAHADNLNFSKDVSRKKGLRFSKMNVNVMQVEESSI